MHKHVFVNLPEHVSRVQRRLRGCRSFSWQELLERREAEIRAKVPGINGVLFVFVFVFVFVFMC
jgi:hypothetical protein